MPPRLNVGLIGLGRLGRVYARDLAGAYHSYYAAERVVGVAPELSRARVALLAATRQVLANALGMLGVSAPEQMNRDTPETSPNPDSE